MAHRLVLCTDGDIPTEDRPRHRPGPLRVAWEPVAGNRCGGEAEHDGHLLASSRAGAGLSEAEWTTPGPTAFFLAGRGCVGRGGLPASPSVSASALTRRTHYDIIGVI